MRKIIIWITGALALVITGVMDFVYFPRIEKNTDGIKAFDMNSFGYPPEQAQRFLDLIDEDARQLYLKKQLPLDSIYPFIYTTFFSTALTALNSSKATKALPGILFTFDYLENMCSIKMLKDKKAPTKLARFASTMTLCKSLTMYTIFGILGFKFYKSKK